MWRDGGVWEPPLELTLIVVDRCWQVGSEVGGAICRTRAMVGGHIDWCRLDVVGSWSHSTVFFSKHIAIPLTRISTLASNTLSSTDLFPHTDRHSTKSFVLRPSAGYRAPDALPLLRLSGAEVPSLRTELFVDPSEGTSTIGFRISFPIALNICSPGRRFRQKRYLPSSRDASWSHSTDQSFPIRIDIPHRRSTKRFVIPRIHLPPGTVLRTHCRC